jgi:hypothetical protein
MEISDQTLIILTVIALITTVGGTVLILQKLGPDVPALTGLASAVTGTVNVTIDPTVSIILNVDHINFSGGSVVSGSLITELNTTGADGGGANPSTFADPGDFLIENNGNVDVNLTINGTPAANWIGGTSPTYRFSHNAPGTDDGCANNRTNTAPTTLNAGLLEFCINLTFTDAADTTNISIYLGIPSDIPSGSITDPAVLITAAQATNFVG